MSAVEEGADARASSSLEDAEERLSRDGQRARRRPIGLRQIVQGDDVLGELPDLVARIAAPGPVLVLADAVLDVDATAWTSSRTWCRCSRPHGRAPRDPGRAGRGAARRHGRRGCRPRRARGCRLRGRGGLGHPVRHRQEGDRGPHRDALHRGPDRLLRERVLGRHGGAAARTAPSAPCRHAGRTPWSSTWGSSRMRQRRSTRRAWAS